MSMFCYQCQETAGGKGCNVLVEKFGISDIGTVDEDIELFMA